MQTSFNNQLYEWVKAKAKHQIEDFDLHGTHKKSTKISFEKGKFKNNTFCEEKHLNLRVLKGEKQGIASTKDFSKTGIEDCYQRAVESLNLSDKKQRGDLAANSVKYPDFKGFYNKELESVSLEDKIAFTDNLSKACFDHSPLINNANIYVSDHDNKHFFVNSKGVLNTYRTTQVSADNVCYARQKQSNSVSWYTQGTRSYNDIDLKTLIARSAGQAVKKLNPIQPKTKKYPVIFKSGDSSATMLYLLTELMQGKRIFEGLSLLKDSLNKKIFSDQFSLIDNPLATWGFAAKPFDGEGFCSEKTTLVKNGVLENFLTSSFFAKALKVPHTKKACWMDTNLDMASTNLIMESGKDSFNDLVSTYPEVVIIDMIKGHAGWNAVSGDLSKDVEGFLFSNGEIKPISQFTVSGNIKDVFKNIAKVAADSQICDAQIQSPSFLVPELTISGK